jgi:hypothetical protein
MRLARLLAEVESARPRKGNAKNSASRKNRTARPERWNASGSASPRNSAGWPRRSAWPPSERLRQREEQRLAQGRAGLARGTANARTSNCGKPSAARTRTRQERQASGLPRTRTRLAAERKRQEQEALLAEQRRTCEEARLAEQRRGRKGKRIESERLARERNASRTNRPPRRTAGACQTRGARGPCGRAGRKDTAPVIDIRAGIAVPQLIAAFGQSLLGRALSARPRVYGRRQRRGPADRHPHRHRGKTRTATVTRVDHDEDRVEYNHGI